MKKPPAESNIPETKKVFASSVSDAKVSYRHSIAITTGQQFLYKYTSCSLSAIFYGNLNCTDDEPQTAKLVQWRHSTSTVLNFQSSAMQKAWRVM